MFEKLLSLLLHAKGGALATVFVLGASGALVTATVENGNATITITKPSSGAAETAVTPVTTVSNTTSNNTTVDPAILALFTRTKAEDDPTRPATGNGCSDAAKANNEQVKRINDEFKTDHQTVGKLRKDARTDAAKKAVSDADHAIKDIRQAAVKAIHATNPSATCHKDQDEDDNDVDDEDDDDDSAPSTTAPTTPALVFSGDAKAIADAAIAAMALWVKDAQAAIDAQPAATANEPKKSDNGKSDKGKSDNKSNRDNHDNKGRSGDHGHEDDD